ncbi:MAG: tRNA (adenosine(37)-N6)-dimethylallyltransferase MiaA [Thermoflexibacter sp.]
MNYLITIVGATAVGKTSMAIRLAQYFDTEIISADSRQFYIEMNVGTAKPSAEELKAVKHHFINSHHIDNEYNAGQFEKDALVTLTEIFQRKRVAILVGGSGLYVKALCEGFDEMPEVAPTIRKSLQEEFAVKGLAPLLKELEQEDLAYYQLVDKANPHRILRALEVIRSTHSPYSLFRKKENNENQTDRPFQIIKIGLDRPREELYQRIEERMDMMIEEGLLEEVKKLYQYKHLNAMQTVGYQEIIDFLDGKYDWEEAVRLMKRNSRRYAKRQLTWFRKDTQIQWFSPNTFDKIVAYIQESMD